MVRACLMSLFLFVMGLSANSWSDTVFVDKVESRSLAETDRMTLYELLKIAVGSVPGYSTIENRDQAQIVLEPKALKLGESYILSVKKHTKTGRSFQAEMKSTKIDEFDVV